MSASDDAAPAAAQHHHHRHHRHHHHHRLRPVGPCDAATRAAALQKLQQAAQARRGASDGAPGGGASDGAGDATDSVPLTSADAVILGVLDRSGSMASVIDAARASCNQFVADQARLPGRALVSMVLFDKSVSFVHGDFVPARSFPLLDASNYAPGRGTALCDGICLGLEFLKAHPLLGGAASPPKVFVVVQTDGAENASQLYSVSDCTALIAEARARGWNIIFLGADQAAMRAAARMGVPASSSLSYSADSKHHSHAIASVSAAVERSRAAPDCLVLSFLDTERISASSSCDAAPHTR